MKKIFASVLIAVSVFTISCSQSPATDEKVSLLEGPSIEFKVLEHNFGTMQEAGDGSTAFVFTNTGTEPLILSNVRSSCGCTVPEWPREPIAPGASSEIKVKYDTRRIGRFQKSISVYSNAQEAPIVLKIYGEVAAAAAEQATE